MNVIHLTRPLNDLAVGRVHVNAQKMQREMLPVVESVASRVAHHCRGAGDTAFLRQRYGLFNEAKEYIGTFTLSTSLPRSKRRYPGAISGFSRVVLSART